MARALKIVGTIVAVVGMAAAAISTFGASLGFTAAAMATAGTIATAASIAAGALALASAALTKRPSFSQEGNPLQFTTNPQSGLPYPMGRTRLGGLRIHGDTYDAPAFASEGKQDILSFAVLLGAGGPMEEIETFRGDDITATFNPSTGECLTGFAGWMAQKVSLGVTGASALALAFGGGDFPGWTTDHKLTGIAHALWDIRFDPKGEKFTSGVPQPQWIGKWVKVYDPRKDSTYPGGSGSHRALDESTYEWSENPALHALTWALGRWQNDKRTLGIGAPVANIRVADFVEAANVADANGWTCGGVEWSTDSKWAILKRILQAGGAEPTMTGAMIGCRVFAPAVPLVTVQAEDLLDKLVLPTTKPRRERFNSVVPRYRSEEHEWEVISGEPITVPEYVAMDGGVRTKEIDFPLVQAHAGSEAGHEQAGHLATYEIVNSREAGPVTFTVGPAFAGIRTGDCIAINVPERGLVDQPLIVRSRALDPATLKITFTAETETEGKHEYALGQSSVPPLTFSPTVPNLTPPMPDDELWVFDYKLTGGTLPLLRIAGVCEFPGADYVLMRYREDGASSWITLADQTATEPIEHEFGPVDGGVTYEAQVAYKSGRRIGPWLDLAPVTTPTWDLSDYDQLYDDFYGSNNQNGDAITAPTIPGGGAAIDHVEHANGTVDVSFEWTWAGDEATIDGFEVVVMGRSSASAYTIGTTPASEHKDTMSPDKRAYIMFGVPPELHYTFYVRAYRRVDPNVLGTTLITSDWVKSTVSGENPYLPNANLPFAGNVSGTIDGEASSNVADATQNFNLRNDRDNSTPASVTIASDGTAVDHTLNVDGSADLSFEWSWGGTEASIDGFEVLLYSRTSSSAYTIGSDPAGELVTGVPPNKRAFIVKGVPANLYYTFAARPFRIVDPDVDADGIIYGAWVKPSLAAENPYQPAANVAFTGLIGSSISGVSATTIAAAVDGTTGKIATGKVVTDSILPGAINLAGYAQVNATLFANGPTTGYLLLESGSETDCIDGETVIVTAVVPCEMALNGSTGTEHVMTIYPIIWTNGGVDIDYGPGSTFSIVKTSSDVYTGKRLLTVRGPVTVASGSGIYGAGMAIDLDANTDAGFYPTMYFELDNPKAAQ